MVAGEVLVRSVIIRSGSGIYLNTIENISTYIYIEITALFL